MNRVEKPLIRKKWRRRIGKEYFSLKRKWHWYFGNQKWAKMNTKWPSSHVVFEHRSLILRPLKDVDMILQENKRQNLALALQKLNFIEINPGETFSIWKNVGKPTRSKGYLEGLILHQGKVERGVGGGLCQLGNLLFWIIAHSPLQITERHRHSFDVFPDVNRKIPFGAGATLAYNYIDFQFINNTPYRFQLELWLDQTHLNGRLVCDTELKESFHLEERNHRFEQQIWGGYTRHNQLFKITKDESGLCQEELFVENHALMMYTPFLEGASE